jgi:alkylhydroperoxidase/carboxymuconolactone decarboxylase family protein YurZ
LIQLLGHKKRETGMLTKRQQELYNTFYESTHKNEYLDQKTEILVGLSAAIAMNCAPCTEYYLKQAKKADISKGEISEVLAKVMAVAAGQKRLQLQEAVKSYGVDLESYK